MKIIDSVIEYIENHLFDDLSADAVARAALSNKYNVMRVFSAATDYTLAEYIRLRRLSEAGKMLCETNRKIIDVAYDCGYETAESFTKAFKKFNGFTPAECRKNKKYNSVPVWTTQATVKALNFERTYFNDEVFIGFKKRFSGKAEHRLAQDEQFAVSTRKKQEALRTARSKNDCNWWEILDNFDENGFDTTMSVIPEKLNFDYESLARKTENPSYDYRFTAEDIENTFGNFVTYRICGKYACFTSENADFPMQGLDSFTKSVYEGLGIYDFERDETRPELLEICWFGRDRIHDRHLRLYVPIV